MKKNRICKFTRLSFYISEEAEEISFKCRNIYNLRHLRNGHLVTLFILQCSKDEIDKKFGRFPGHLDFALLVEFTHAKSTRQETGEGTLRIFCVKKVINACAE